METLRQGSAGQDAIQYMFEIRNTLTHLILRSISRIIMSSMILVHSLMAVENQPSPPNPQNRSLYQEITDTEVLNFENVLYIPG